MASRALRDGGQSIKKAVYEAGEALKKLHEVGTGDRLQQIVEKAEKKRKG